jgi:hypothetical protein
VKVQQDDPTALTALCIDIPPTAAAMCRVPIPPKLCSHCCSCRPQVLLALLWFLCILRQTLCQHCLSGSFVFCVGLVCWHFQFISCGWSAEISMALIPYDSDCCKSCMSLRWYILIWVETGNYSDDSKLESYASVTWLGQKCHVAQSQILFIFW